MKYYLAITDEDGNVLAGRRFEPHDAQWQAGKIIEMMEGQDTSTFRLLPVLWIIQDLVNDLKKGEGE